MVTNEHIQIQHTLQSGVERSDEKAQHCRDRQVFLVDAKGKAMGRIALRPLFPLLKRLALSTVNKIQDSRILFQQS